LGNGSSCRSAASQELVLHRRRTQETAAKDIRSERKEKMTKQLRSHFYVEIALGTLSCIGLATTLINRAWIESMFGVDPDQGSGVLEWAIVAGFMLAALVSLSLAGYEWRRFRAAIAD
jgi:hypothetical protein